MLDPITRWVSFPIKKVASRIKGNPPQVQVFSRWWFQFFLMFIPTNPKNYNIVNPPKKLVVWFGVVVSLFFLSGVGIFQPPAVRFWQPNFHRRRWNFWVGKNTKPSTRIATRLPTPPKKKNTYQHVTQKRREPFQKERRIVFQSQHV